MNVIFAALVSLALVPLTALPASAQTVQSIQVTDMKQLGAALRAAENGRRDQGPAPQM